MSIQTNMDTVNIIIVVICIIFFFFAIREEFVYREKRRIRKIIKEFIWRVPSTKENKNFANMMIEEYNKIRYCEMIFKFWKPVKSFYNNGPWNEIK